MSNCGCCGRELGTDVAGTADGLWCVDCIGHVLKGGALWDRTWFAQHGNECPFQVKD